MMGGAQQGEDAWVLSPVIHFMGGTPEDHANVARANGKAVRSAPAPVAGVAGGAPVTGDRCGG